MEEPFDMLGWDTVFAISHENLNKAITKSKSTPATFDYKSADSDVTISGKWSDWQLAVGGSGGNLQLSCPIASGTAVKDSLSADLSGSSLVIQVKLSQIPDPGYPSKSSPGKDGTANLFKVKASSTKEDPAVSVVGSDFPKVTGKEYSLLKSALPNIFQEYFIKNIADFNHVFAVVDLNLKADTRDYQWLMPTSTSYACAPARDKTLKNSVFAILCTTDDAPTGLLEQGVDARLLENLAAGTNSRFLINSFKVLQHILLPGAVLNIQGSSADDFDIINDNNWIATNKDLTWGNFELEGGNKISPVIKAGNFKMGIEDNFIVIQIIDAQADWTGWHGPGEIILHLNMTQYVELELKKTAKGWVLMPKPLFEKVGDKVIKHGEMNIACNVTTSEGVQIFEICVGIAAAIIGSIVGSVLGAAFDAAGTVVVKDTTQAAIKVVADDVIPALLREVEGDFIKFGEDTALLAATDAVENAGTKTFSQTFKTAISSAKWKLFGGLLGTALGSQIGFITTYMKLAANGQFDDIPTFNNFAASCIGATTFPGTSDWELKDAGLRSSLALTGDLKIAD